MERDCFYNELKYVRDYACKAAGLDSEIAGWKTAVDAMTKQLADAQEQVGSYKLVNDMHLKTVDKLSRQVEALQREREIAVKLRLSPEGAFVYYDEYRALRDERDRLREALERVLEQWVNGRKVKDGICMEVLVAAKAALTPAGGRAG